MSLNSFGAIIEVHPGRTGGRTLYLAGDGGYPYKKVYKTEGCSCCSCEYRIIRIIKVNSPEYPEMLRKCIKERNAYYKRLLSRES